MSPLRDFWGNHPEAQKVLKDWFKVLESQEFANFTEVKRTFNTVDYVAPFTVFDVGGNKYRVITDIHYNRKKVYIRYVLTHAEYDRNKWKVK
ncbi:type II toxin-antitoxin system HigB family toxin [Caballeronia sordidicola]|jgi:mRNA interferase HigB|uniref:type II toxin-antitoxin system HigB family toxin n=1 Tax=Caballeronia sordidicola TaxID=196367 RepID=UPI00211A3F17|nr:type II toxin-antitoxin system HigB family toxin [Caballeronia sordidicola]